MSTKEAKERRKSRSRERKRSKSKERKKGKERSHKQKDKGADIEKEKKRADRETEKEIEKIQIEETDLIPSLKDVPDFLTKEYNKRTGRLQDEVEEEEKKVVNDAPPNDGETGKKADSFAMPSARPPVKQTDKAEPREEEKKQQPDLNKSTAGVGRAGGVYIPPFRLAQLKKELLEEEKNGVQHQKLMWELLRKSINGVINKVNISNIQNIIVELLNENILRGKGLLARAIIKAQMASPNFTHVYASLIAVINTKLPEIANLIIRRVVLQFQRAYSRNNKIVCMATTRMLAHLINQKVFHDFAGLQLLSLLLENPTEDGVEIACDFMIECGQVLSDLTPAGVNAIFERFKGILHEGEIERKVQYSIENLFAIRKSGFKDHPGVIPELDLVEEEDQIIHQIMLDDDIDGEEHINIFKFDPFYEKTEEEWAEIKREILGEDNILRLKNPQAQGMDAEEEEEPEEQIQDFSEQDLINLRRTIYLVIMNSIDFEECAHKVLKINLGTGHEDEVANMIIECCMQERTYLRFYGLLSQRFCMINELYKQEFFKSFVEKYTTIHRYETNKLRNIAKMFAHLLYTNAIDWHVFECMVVTQDNTSSSGRIFIKILFQELAENMGLEKFKEKLLDPDLREYTRGLFPLDHPRNTRFSINFFTSIGLGAITEEMREFIKTTAQAIPDVMTNEKEGPFKKEANDESSDESSSSESSDSSDSDSSDSSADEKEKKYGKKQGDKAPAKKMR